MSAKIVCPKCGANYVYQEEQKPQSPSDKATWLDTRTPGIQRTSVDGSLEAQAIVKLIGNEKGYTDNQAKLRYWVFKNSVYRSKA